MKSSFRHEIRRTLVPGADPHQGPLTPLLVGLTVVSGLVDQVNQIK
jgi:hypothetical protein